MSNLRNFIRSEVKRLAEGFIDVPQEMLDKDQELFDYFKEHEEEIRASVYTKRIVRTFMHPYLPPELRGFFNVTGRDGTDMPIDVGFYSGKMGEVARMNARDRYFLLNIDRDINLYDLRQAINHELVHALDPFKKHPSFEEYAIKHRVDLTDDRGEENPHTGLSRDEEKYYKSQHEYAAYLSQIINGVKPYVQGDEEKIKHVVRLAKDIPNYEFEDLIDRYAPVFRRNTLEVLNSLKFSIVRAWSTRPTLFRKFLKDLMVGLRSRRETR